MQGPLHGWATAYHQASYAYEHLVCVHRIRWPGGMRHSKHSNRAGCYRVSTQRAITQANINQFVPFYESLGYRPVLHGFYKELI